MIINIQKYKPNPVEKKILKTRKHIRYMLMLILASIASTITLKILNHYMYGYLSPDDFNKAELICFIAWCTCAIYTSALVTQANKNSRIIRICCIIGFSIVSTATVYFINSLFHYYEFNSMFNWVNPLPYSHFLAEDITYTYANGWMRYPLVLLANLLANSIVCTDFIFKVKQRFLKRYSSDNYDNTTQEAYPSNIIPFNQHKEI